MIIKIQYKLIIITWRIDLSKLANKFRSASDELTGDKGRKLDRECISEVFFVKFFQFSSAMKLIKHILVIYYLYSTIFNNSK